MGIALSVLTFIIEKFYFHGFNERLSIYLKDLAYDSKNYLVYGLDNVIARKWYKGVFMGNILFLVILFAATTYMFLKSVDEFKGQKFGK